MANSHMDEVYGTNTTSSIARCGTISTYRENQNGVSSLGETCGDGDPMPARGRPQTMWNGLKIGVRVRRGRGSRVHVLESKKNAFKSHAIDRTPPQ